MTPTMTVPPRPRRILHLVLPRLATDRLARERARLAPPGQSRPAGAEPPRATILKSRGAVILAAVDARAAAAGLQPGQGLADARAMVPALLVDPADPEVDTAALTALARAADRYTPLVAPTPPDGLFLDITGCSHLFGGEAALVGDLLARLARAGYAAAVAVADRPSVAWALARHGGGGRVSAGDEIAAVSPLPAAALQLPEEVVAVLHRVGLKTVGDILRQPRAPLVQRFGPLLARRIDAIEGRISEPITPVAPVPPVMAERRFAEPVTQAEALEPAFGALADEVARLLTRRGEGARTLRLRLFHANGDVGETAVGASEPLADAKRMRALLIPRLRLLAERVEADSGIDLVRLHAEETAPLAPRQVGFDGDEQMAADLAQLIDTLSERLGAEAVRRFVPVDTHDPACAGLTLSAREVFFAREASPRAPAARAAEWRVAAPASATSWPGPADAPAHRPLGAGETHPSHDAWDTPPAGPSAVDAPTLPLPAWVTERPPERPLRLFTPPEPVETVAGVPDGPPIRFRWRRVAYLVAAAEGPERIAPAWWEERGETCDYFRVEDVEGRRFWMFRRGLYGEAVLPCWFVHGLFA